MGSSGNNINQLIDLLRPNSLILTPNQRLSRSLSQALNNIYISHQTAWPTPKILPLNTWLLQLIEAQRIKGEIPLKPLAQPLEELDTWQTIVEADENVTVRSKALAKLAKTAYQTVGDWQLDIEQHSFEFNADEDTKHFLAWQRQYTRQQASLPFICQVDAVRLLERAQGPLDVHLVLVGFQSIAPLHQSIINKAASHETFTWQATLSRQRLYAATDVEQEFEEMALWARATHVAHPNDTIAVCVPDLNQTKASVLAALDEVFQPNAVLPNQQRSEQFYDVSAGMSLVDTPLGSVLRNCLAAMKQTLPLIMWQALLTSPFITLTENLEVSKIQLGNFPVPQATIGQLAIWLGAQSPLEPLYQLSKGLSKARGIGQWALAFKEVMQAWYWAGGRTLSSHEYQQQQLCLQALAQFSDLRLRAKTLRFNKAFELFSELLSQQVFHAQTPPTKISVLGSLEAAGQVFDHLWVCGMQDNQWPPKLSPNPFIPSPMQHSLAMPRGSTEREFDYAQQLLNGFAGSAGNVVFSYTAQADDVAVNLTRLLALDAPEQYQGLATEQNPPQLSLVDIIDLPIRLNSQERDIAATALKDQSQCPFKAFSARRLGLKAMPTRSEGLSATDRGNLIHRALESFFSENGNSEAISDADDACLAKAYTAAAAVAINSFSVKKKRLYKPALFELEQWRLEALLKEWVTNGEGRTQPFRVQALEHEHRFEIAGLNIHMRLDRIDVVNRQWFIIDYKSSAPSSHNWQAERLFDPQLPLYAVALADNNICGIAVAHVRPNESTLKALANNNAGISKPVDDDVFEQLIVGQWRSQITELAQEYSSGRADVDPVSPNVCNVCDYSSVCRIFEAGQSRVS